MPTRALSTKLALTFVVAVLFLVVGLAAVRSINEVNASRRWGYAGRMFTNSTSALDAAAARAESSERAYLLTGDARFLAPYRADVTAARASLARATELARGVPARERFVADVTPRLAAKIADMDDVLATMGRAGRDEAVARLRAADGDPARTDVHSLVLVRAAEEEGLLRGLRGGVEHRLHGTYVIVLAGSVLAFLVLVLLDVSIWRDVRQRARDQALITSQAGELRVYADGIERRERALSERVAAQEALMAELSRVNASLDEEARHREELIAALAASNQELEQFAYVASHDLKAPLRGIGNLADWIAEDLGEPVLPAVAENLRLLRGRVVRMEGLIAGILAYARAGREESAVDVEVRALVHDVIELLAPPEGTAVVVEGPMPSLHCEPVPFQQVWMNLLGNALKHGEGREVAVGARDAGEAWEFFVRDRGPGIDPRYHERIFGIFQTLNPRDKVEGTGIGLAIVKKIVESRGGRVTLESAPGEGATFRFTWPKQRQAGRRASTGPRPSPVPASATS